MGPWPWWGTFTFRIDVHPETADKLWDVWIGNLNRKLSAERHSEGVRGARASEPQRRGVIHFHAMMGAEGLEDVHRLRAMHDWEHLDDSRPPHRRRPGFARIEPPRDADAVRRYCSKYVLKGGEIDLFGPGMHDPPPTRWPRDFVPWPVWRKLNEVRDVVSHDELQGLQRWARLPGFAIAPALVAEVRARLVARRPLTLWSPEVPNGAPGGVRGPGGAS